MHIMFGAAALFAATPSLAENSSPFLGPQPDTIILDGGWQMTPAPLACMLMHRSKGPVPDMGIIAPRHDEGVILATMLPARGAFTAPVQLTVVADGPRPETLGRVTFQPTTGARGTLLMGKWPAASLLPRVVRAERLRFSTPDQRLLRAVTLTNNAAAVDALNACRDMGGRHQPGNAPATPEHPGFDVGWVAQDDRDGCGFARMTRIGNELALRYTHKAGMLVIYRMHVGPRFNEGEAVTVSVDPVRVSVDGAVSSLALHPSLLTMQSTNPGDAPVLFARTPRGFLATLRSPELYEARIAAGPLPEGQIDDSVKLDGAAAAIDDMATCMRKLPH